MSYMTREITVTAIEKMKVFHDSLIKLHDDHSLDFFDDLGRRNILMSRPQEAFFCEALKQKFPKTFSDGRTGQPDIVLPDISKELECKITTKRKGGSWQLQADYATLEKKGSCDFLYFCCDPEFKKFAVLHFENLDVSDFKSPAPGSRGKARLTMKTAFSKCTPLVGNIESTSEKFLEKAYSRLAEAQTDYQKKRERKSVEFWKNSHRYSITLEKI